MGCGNSKTEAFVGTADAEIQHYCGIIGELSGYNWEQGSAPVAKTDEALRNIYRIAEENSGLQHATVDLLASVTEAMRVENQGLYNKFSADFNKARIAVCSKTVAAADSVDQFDMEVKGPWVPRVVTLQAGSVVPLGSSASLSVSGVGAVIVGFCVETWVRVLSKPANKADPAISFLTTYGSLNAEVGANPHFALQQDGRLSMDFQSKSPLIAKKALIEPGVWAHVAFVVGQGQMRILLNGRRVGERPSPRVWGEVALKIQAYVSVEMCEYRLWNVERSDTEVAENIGTSISPRTCEDFRELRLCWFPLPAGSDLYTPGSLCYDTWRRLSIGCRVNASPIMDSRWPCALPYMVAFTLLDSNRGQLTIRHNEELFMARERRDLVLHAMMMLDPPLPFTAVETKAQLVAYALMMEGGPWIPRVVTLTPGVHADLGTAAELGLAVHPSVGVKRNESGIVAEAGDIWAKSHYSSLITGFTVETWVRIRSVLPGQDNCIIGYGNGAAISNGESLYIVIRDGRAVMGFLGAEFEIEADIIIPPMQWTHVAFSCDASGKQTIFANGAPIASHVSKAALSGNCALTLGGCGDGNSFLGDICELRIWNRVLVEDDILKYMKIAIPPLAGHAHRDLRCSWFPLRRGGPLSQQLFQRLTATYAQRADQKPEGTLSAAATQAATAFKTEARALAAADLKFPSPSFLWDVDRRVDLGRLTHASTLLVTRTRVPPVPALIPTSEFLPKHWSKSAVALIDDWSDCFDRMFTASWPIPPAFDAHGAQLTPPDSAAAAVARASPWVPRTLLYKNEVPLSCKVGTTAEIGIGSIGAMGRQFTLEVWVHPRAVVYPTKKLLFQDIFGHEDDVSNRGTLLFGLGRPEALRIGLANGVPFMNFAGAIKSLKPSEVKECGVIAPYAIPVEHWTHLSFGVDGNGVMRITIDGKTVVEKNKTNPLKAKGDSMIYAFGYPGREIFSDVCELRVWSSYRTEDEVANFMHMGLTPLDTGGPRVPNLRLCWFPLRSMRSVLWDTKMLRHRVCYHEMNRTLGPQLTRRPHLLPPFVAASLTTMPAAPILDDRGDAFERIFLPDLIPPVVRHKRPPGSKSDLVADVDYTAVDWDFLPFSSSMPELPGKAKKKEKKSSGLGLAAAKTRKEKENLDIGWRDIDDGTWTENDGFDFDDGGYLHEWGGMGSLEKALVGAELYDVSNRISSRDSQDNFNLDIDKARKMSIGSDFGKDIASPASIASTVPTSAFGSDKELLGLKNNDPDISVGVIDPIKENPNAFPNAVTTVSVVQKIEHSVQKKLPPLENSPRTEVDIDGNVKKERRKSKDEALDSVDTDGRHTNINTAKRRKTREPKEFVDPQVQPAGTFAAIQ